MIYGYTGKQGEGMTLHRYRRNQTSWVSISQFLEKDPLAALGLAGGWARAESEASAAPAPGPEFHTPPSNTGVNKVGVVAGVEQ